MSEPYRVLLTSRAQRDLNCFHSAMLRQLSQSISELSLDPRGMGTRKLQGSDAMYRKRSGDYRILYKIDDKNREVTVHRVVDRKDAY